MVAKCAALLDEQPKMLSMSGNMDMIIKEAKKSVKRLDEDDPPPSGLFVKRIDRVMT